MTAFDPHKLLAESSLGILATIKANGLPQLSPVQPSYVRGALDLHVNQRKRAAQPLRFLPHPSDNPGSQDDLGVIYVSTSDRTAKVANLRRDPRAALEVTSPDGWAWATAEGTVTLTGPGTDPDGPEVQALVDYYRTAAGEHPDWDEYRSVMVSERRVLITITVEHVYGAEIR